MSVRSELLLVDMYLLLLSLLFKLIKYEVITEKVLLLFLKERTQRPGWGVEALAVRYEPKSGLGTI